MVQILDQELIPYCYSKFPVVVLVLVGATYSSVVLNQIGMKFGRIVL